MRPCARKMSSRSTVEGVQGNRDINARPKPFRSLDRTHVYISTGQAKASSVCGAAWCASPECLLGPARRCLGSLVEGTKLQQASRHTKARSLVLAAFTRKPG